MVAIGNELRTSRAQVTALGGTAVDWSAVITELSARIPAGLSVTTFTGTDSADSAAASSSSSTTGAATGITAPVAGSIGQLTVGVSGTFPSSAHFDPVARVDRQPDGVVVVQPPRGEHGGERAERGQHGRDVHLQPVAAPQRRPDQERELLMEQLTRYRVPILTGLGTLVLIIIVFVAWISPEGTKLSSLHAQQTQLESQESHLQTELATLRNAKAHLVSNCAQLTTDLGEIPGTPSVDDFFHDVTTLAVSSGDLNTPSISVTQASTQLRAAPSRWRSRSPCPGPTAR